VASTVSDILKALDAECHDNATLITKYAKLGYLPSPVLDLTVGEEAGFWTQHKPTVLITNDLDPEVEAHYHYDATDTPFPANRFRTVVWDPPYKLSGTRGSKGPAALNKRYGTSGKYVPIGKVHSLLLAGVREAIRLSSEFVLVKCQDQIASGAYQPQTFLVYEEALSRGAKLVDMGFVEGYRKQPEYRKVKGVMVKQEQKHLARNYSSLMVFSV
jgi:hypothetical protein